MMTLPAEEIRRQREKPYLFSREDVIALLEERGMDYELTEHAAAMTMEDLAAIELPYPEADAKNLFVRDDKKQHYYLLTVHGERRVDLKEFAARFGTRRLSFASPDDLLRILELTPGSVTPLGLLNDRAHRVSYYLDRQLAEEPGLVGVHPMVNTATLWLKTADLIGLLAEFGTETTLF